jgi:glycosyltransferase involved in cell wall biosynthesis
LTTHKNYKILMISLTNIIKGEGGAQHQLSLAEYFMNNGHEVKLIAPRRQVDEEAPEIFRNVGTWSMSLCRFGLPGSLDSILQIPLLIWYRLTGNYKVLYTRAVALTVLVNLVARLLFMKVIVEHNGWLATERRERTGNNFLARIESTLQIFSAQTAHMNRTVTKGLRRLLEEGGVSNKKITVIGNGTDISRFYPMDRKQVLNELEWDVSITRIGFIGGIVPWQGLETAVKALANLNDLKNVRLVIAGDGPDLPRIRRLADELGVSTIIDFLGYISRQKANLIINSFDIAIAPFTQQRNMEIGLSAIKIRDYAAAGRVVICSDIPELLEAEATDWIRFYQPDDVNELSQKLMEVMSDGSDKSKNQIAAREYAENYFDWNIMASRVLACISDL